MDRGSRIYVAGHRGLVGSAIVRALEAEGYANLVTATRDEVDLCDQAATRRFLDDARPEYVVVAAARVGGILANDTYPADFIYDNLMIEANVIDAAFRVGVRKLLFLGSTCIYPRLARQPLKEEYLLTGPLEETNQWYAVAKIAGIKLCQAYRRQHGCNYVCAMPTNLYGPDDNFDLATAHVLPALIRRFHEAKAAGASSVTIWGSGSPRREFCHTTDAARACVHLLRHYDEESIVNIGVGEDISVLDLARLIAEVVGFAGEIRTDPAKPDGTPRKLVDVTRILATGWRPTISLADGIRDTYEWYQRHLAQEAG